MPPWKDVPPCTDVRPCTDVPLARWIGRASHRDHRIGTPPPPPCTDVPSARWIGRWHPREADAELPPSMCIGNVPKARQRHVRTLRQRAGRLTHRETYSEITPVNVHWKRAKGTSVHCDGMAVRCGIGIPPMPPCRDAADAPWRVPTLYPHPIIQNPTSYDSYSSRCP